MLGIVSVQVENWYMILGTPVKPLLMPEIPPLVIDSFGLKFVLFSLGVRY